MQQEIWKDIPGYLGLYKVSNLGNVIGTKRKGTNGAPLKQHVSKAGYYYIHLYKNGVGKPFKIHRLVAITFIPNPENKSQINHKDGNKLNNNVENLEWATPKENTQHALKVLNVKRCSGIKHPKSLKIAIYENGKYVGISYGHHSTAKRIGCSPSGVEYLLKNQTTSKKGFKLKVLCK